jgi:hypothetical protein
VQHPALGTFAVEVDGTLLQNVVSTGPQTFGKHIELDGLTPGTHTLRVDAMSGTIALDAFGVEPQQLVIPTATLVPTVSTLTATPTATPTATATAQPPLMPPRPP